MPAHPTQSPHVWPSDRTRVLLTTWESAVSFFFRRAIQALAPFSVGGVGWEGNRGTDLIELLWGSNEFINVPCLESAWHFVSVKQRCCSFYHCLRDHYFWLFLIQVWPSPLSHNVHQSLLCPPNPGASSWSSSPWPPGSV